MNLRSALALSGLASFLFIACGGSAASGPSRFGGSSTQMQLLEASNGFGRLLPHTVDELDENGVPTGNVIEIRSREQLGRVSLTNPIDAPIQWDVDPKLPNSVPGNHYIYARFSREIMVQSVIDPTNSGNQFLTGAISIVSVDPLDGSTTQLSGRPFVGGITASGGALETWLEHADGDPTKPPIYVNIGGKGFPGTEPELGGDLAGSNELVEPNTFVFVADDDGDLSTHDTFPAGVQIQMRITRSVASADGRLLEAEGVASSTVGDDNVPAEVLVAGQGQIPVILPSKGDIDVDPQTTIEIFFTEPVQMLTVGPIDDGTPPLLSSSIQLQFGPSTGKVDVPFTVRPFSVFDLTHFELTPTYAFPGSGPAGLGTACANFSQVDILVNPGQFEDLTGNVNILSPSSFFTTAPGAGLVNAPVMPDAIYVGRGGNRQGISVIDLNGFGQGCGNPTYDPERPIVKGNTNFPNNPNVVIQGSLLIPPLAPGSCTFDGGSEGIFTLAKDSSLNDLVATFPTLESVGDMMLGHALDNTFNNSQPFGCQAGGGNICAATGLKVAQVISGGAVTVVPQGANSGVFTIKAESGVENLVSWAPHPNPPPLVFPPLCQSPLIGALEPTSILTAGGILTPGLTNLLTPGSQPLGIPQFNVAPDGLISSEQNNFFQGPSPQQTSITACSIYSLRQQIGQFLYVVDRTAREVVVLNSNRFTVIDRIRVPDPTSLAISPNLDVLAVTNQGANQVSFIDINPASATFHTVFQTTIVGNGPIGIAWTPDNEDILVCNQRENTLSILSAFDFRVRKVVRNQLRSPFEVAITPRQNAIGFSRGVYFAYILNGDGSVAVFESGPSGINGFGFDDTVASLPFTFNRPKTLQPDQNATNSQFWVLHENPLDPQGQPTGRSGGAATLCGMASATFGQISLDVNGFQNPRLRDIQFGIFATVEEDSNGLTGVPVDMAFDNLKNRTALTNISNQFSAGQPLSINGKSIVKSDLSATGSPQFMFLAVPNSREGPGVVDVFEIASGLRRRDTDPFKPGIQSIPVPNATVVMDYLRQ